MPAAAGWGWVAAAGWAAGAAKEAGLAAAGLAVAAWGAAVSADLAVEDQVAGRGEAAAAGSEALAAADSPVARRAKNSCSTQSVGCSFRSPRSAGCKTMCLSQTHRSWSRFAQTNAREKSLASQLR